MARGKNWRGGRHAPQMVMTPELGKFTNSWFDRLWEHFVDQCGFDGFHVAMQWRVPDHPLKRLLSQADQAGLWVHLWMYGDQQDWGEGAAAPKKLSDDRAHQKKVLEALKPYKNWSLGTGYDLQEWVDDAEQKAFVDFCKSIIPDGIFGGRRLKETNEETGALTNEGPYPGNYAGYEWWAIPKDKMREQCRQAISVSKTNPVMWEERGRVRNEGRKKDYVNVAQCTDHIRICVEENVASIWGVQGARGSVSSMGSDRWSNPGQLKSIMKGRFTGATPPPAAPPPPAKKKVGPKSSGPTQRTDPELDAQNDPTDPNRAPGRDRG